MKPPFTPRLDCPKCHGKGTYMYDHNHGKLCEECCPHAEGWFQLVTHYGPLNGQWACRAGCGHVVPEPPP